MDGERGRRRGRWRQAAVFAIALGAAMGTAGQGTAQDALVDEGRAIALKWCAECHVVGDPAQQRALADAPSFRSLGRRADFSEQMLALALMRPHPVMPSFPIDRRDVAALAAYIRTTAREDAASLPPSGPDDELVRAGADLLEVCTSCHAVAGPGPSPVAEAPAFSTLAQRYPLSHLEEALAEGIVVGHGTVQMPQFTFAPDEIAAILAYLETVQAR